MECGEALEVEKNWRKYASILFGVCGRIIYDTDEKGNEIFYGELFNRQ